MSQITTPQQAPLFLGNDAVIAGGTSAALAANTVYILKYVVQVPVLVTAMRWKATATAAGNVNLGIYNAAGTTLLASTGSVANTVASTNASANLTASVTLAPGVYLLAFTVGNNTDTFTRASNFGSGSALIGSYTAANGSTGTTSPVLPATTGALSISATMPVFGGAISGGI